MDDDRIAQLEAEVEKLKRKLTEKDDDDAIRDREDQYRMSRIDNKVYSQEIHGNLKGLNADDHTQYLNNSRHDVSSRHGDAVIGNRTIYDSEVPTGSTGTLKDLFSWLGYMVKAITGKQYWNVMPDLSLMQVLGRHSGTVLPDAAEARRGDIFLKEGGIGTADKVYVCLKNDNDNYVWQEIGSV